MGDHSCHHWVRTSHVIFYFYAAGKFHYQITSGELKVCFFFEFYQVSFNFEIGLMLGKVIVKSVKYSFQVNEREVCNGYQNVYAW